jgi:peptidoglycan/LPS O-acetylase OafA/YrhL
MEYRPDIQGLRAISFLLVFIFHLNASWLPGGFIGVDFFFVISGFLISSIMLKDMELNRFSFKEFFLRRLRRIVPAYYVLLIVVAFVGWYTYLYTDIGTLKSSLTYSWLYISNIFFANGESYFGAKLSENPMLHTWSLSIEMQFYLVLPFVVYWFRKYVLTVFLLLIVLLTAYSTYQLGLYGNKSSMYFALISRIPEFLVGAVYGIIFKSGIDNRRTFNNLFAFVSFSILIICAVLITEESNFPGLLAMLPCIAGANLLVIRNNALSDFLSKKIPVFIGEMSYSLYLWHWPVMAFIRYRTDSYDLEISSVLFIAAFTFLFAFLSYKLVELKSKKINYRQFLKVVTPLSVLFFVYYISIERFSESKKIPDIYSRPSFGMQSHTGGIVEKFGNQERNDSIALIGDSHASMLKPFLDYLGRQNDFSYRTLTCAAFIPIEGIDSSEVSEILKDKYAYSRTLVDITADLIDESKVIIVNSAGVDRLKSVASAIDSTASKLRPDQKMILINTFPTIDRNVLKVNNGFVKQNNTNIVSKKNAKSEAILKQLSEKYNNVYFYDLTKSGVFNTPGYINDTAAYYNPSHINTFASLKLAQDLELDFMRFLNDVIHE